MHRSILLHHHLLKNGGSSFDAMLHASFGPHWGTFDPVETLGHDADPSHLEAFIAEHPELRAISSHIVRPPCAQIGEVRVYPVVFLRDPIVRMASVWAFLRQQHVADVLVAAARAHGFAEFVASLLERKRAANLQARMLAGVTTCCPAHHRRPAPDEIEERAHRALDELPVIGIVERYDESLRAFGAWLAPEFPELRLESRWIHRGDHGLNTHEAIEARLGTPLYERLRAANALDAALHAKALERLAAR
ncbi:MAG: hypothetical protein KGN02_00090 [bacterium]|nr:hypothetical protein [bacterium]